MVGVEDSFPDLGQFGPMCRGEVLVSGSVRLGLVGILKGLVAILKTMLFWP